MLTKVPLNVPQNNQGTVVYPYAQAMSPKKQKTRTGRAFWGVSDHAWAYGNCHMAQRTGLEPATPGVTGRYSNRLNYRCASVTQ